MYGYNQSTREFLKYCSGKLNTGLVDFEHHLTNVIKSKDDKMYATIKEELFKFFTNCNSVYEWIIDTSKGSNLKLESSQEEEESEKEGEESGQEEEEPGARALEGVDEVTLHEREIIETLMGAKPSDSEEGKMLIFQKFPLKFYFNFSF